MKYMGSKARIAKDILPIILRDRGINQCYVEPFAGGMNTMCLVGGMRIANDNNYFLIEMWRKLLNGWIPQKISRDQYHDIKNNKEDYPAHVVGWVGFCCSYCGVWFGSFAGETTTKLGTTRDYQREAINNVIKQLGGLRFAVIESHDYRELAIPPKSVIYCDPPYAGTSHYASKFDNDAFWCWARAKANDGHTVFVSEYGAPVDFECVWEKKLSSSLSANGVTGGNKWSTEKLFRYGG